ncbi:MAG: type II toxin-antitoxin system Phd/YefM family antitoxin [Thermoanaerobaculales bacterium]|nr:type II toxin-antitoxin system Phd/YefM family antitoxin [Thermoanaerobaculales bacterium]
MTIREAKARLNALVDAAERGEQVVLMRGSRLVAAIVPVSAEDLELAPRLTDPQAERLWSLIAAERANGANLTFEGPAEAVAHLGSAPRGPGPRRSSPPRRRGARSRR